MKLTLGTNTLLAAALVSVSGAVVFSSPVRAQMPAPVAASPDSLVGKPAPAFWLPDQNNKTVSLEASKGKWVVLAFYPADLTKGCTFQNKSYSDNAAKFAPLNAVVYTVSTQDTKSKQAFCSKEGLTHTLLSDTGGKTAGAYGVLMPGGKLARRVTYYIAPDGTVAGVDRRIKVQSAADDSLAMLSKLSKAAPRKTSELPGSELRALIKVPQVAPRRMTTLLRTNEPRKTQAVGPASTTVTLDGLVPDFALPDAATGKTSALTTLSAGKKATVLVFLSIHCPCSNSYNERLVQMANAYASQGVRFVGINSNGTEPASVVAAHAKSNGFVFPVLKDENNAIADQLGAQLTPEVFVMSDKGELVYHGPIDDKQDPAKVTKKYLADTLDALVAGQPVPEKTARAFGCSIERVTAASK